MLPIKAKEIYGKSLYEKLNEKLLTVRENSKITFFCHSHGGNVAFMNGVNQDYIKTFLNTAALKRIQVHYHLFETRVLPAVEVSLNSLLDSHENLFVYTYTAANHRHQCYDIFSNFPFCNRVYNVSHDRLYQYKISSYNYTVTHCDTDIFLAASNHLFSRNNLQFQQSDFWHGNKKCKIKRIDGKNYHGVLNKIFFYHAGKIISIPLVLIALFFAIRKGRIYFK